VRVVVQRVSKAVVRVDDEETAAIGSGLCLLVGVAVDDDEADVGAAVDKIVGLRVFGDDAGKMNLSIGDVEGEVLVVSQFTLLGDVRRGRRPSLTGAARPDVAAPLISLMVQRFRAAGIVTAQGVFGASMAVELVNDGPVTLVLEIEDGHVR
jgi:D-tyrosyl-tRNA(Tyr) deacylase